MEVPVLGSTLIRMETDDGIIGVGEAGFSSIYEPYIRPQVEKLKPIVLLQDPFDVERIWQEMYNTTHMWGRRGFETYAISGIENAIWDIIGKACGKPIFKLLGGHKEVVRAYAAHIGPQLTPLSWINCVTETGRVLVSIVVNNSAKINSFQENTKQRIAVAAKP